MVSEASFQGNLDPEVTRSFISTFHGYGNLDAPTWFIGMEEAGGELDEIRLRLATWYRRGKKPVEDVADYHLALADVMPHLGRNFRADRPVIQRTWRGLMVLALALQGRSYQREDLRSFQRNEWGRAGGGELLLELLPLPSPSTSHWYYGALENLSELSDRKRYKAELTPKRVETIRQLIRQHEPKFVVFYGTSYIEHWQDVAGTRFEDKRHLPPARFGYAEAGATRYLSIPHPTYTGLNTAYFAGLGGFLKDTA
jgi:hypothetical protein